MLAIYWFLSLIYHLSVAVGVSLSQLIASNAFLLHAHAPLSTTIVTNLLYLNVSKDMNM